MKPLPTILQEPWDERAKPEPSSDRPWLRHIAELVGTQVASSLRAGEMRAQSGVLFIFVLTDLQGCSHSRGLHC